MADVYFVDTVKCMLGPNSNCVMNGSLRLGPACAKCGFNRNVHDKRVKDIRDGKLVEFSEGARKGLRGLEVGGGLMRGF